MYRFPSSPNRRKRWLVQVKRDRWEPAAASRVCAAHFEDASFEENRLDGFKKLRPDAVPTLFPYRAAPKHRKSPKKRTCALTPANSSKTKRVCTSGDVPQQPLHPGDVKIPDHNVPSKSPLDKAANGADNTCELRCHRALAATSPTNVPPNNVVSHTDGTPESSRDDQIKALATKTRIRKWSQKTIQVALQIKHACGTTGYEFLRSLSYPLPSNRTLIRRMQNIRFLPGIHTEVLEVLKRKAETMQDIEKDCVLFMDEMEISQGFEHDRSLDCLFGDTPKSSSYNIDDSSYLADLLDSSLKKLAEDPSQQSEELENLFVIELTTAECDIAYSINKDRFSIACYRALPAAMDQLEEEWRPPTLDDPWRLQLWPYRPHSPIVWFAQVDAQLYVNGVSSQLWRYLLLKREIPTDVFSRLDLLSSDQNMYEGLKTAFFQHFGVPVPDHLRSMTQFPSTADASEGMAQTTSSSSPSASGERCAPARESSAAPTPQEPLCGGNTTTVSPASGSFPDDEQPPATLPAPSTTQLVSPLFLSNDHLASTPVHTEESAFTPPELHGVHSPSRGDDSAASEQHCGETGPPAITCTALPSYASVFPHTFSVLASTPERHCLDVWPQGCLLGLRCSASENSCPARPEAPLLRWFSSLRPPDFTQVPGRTLLQRTSKAPALNTEPMFTGPTNIHTLAPR
ncbi:hypothetical protein HPB49_003365 [Dermacentor silvarum]|uniref:Uncharacterized protein n=1 Tax=Dermacentor silvarum TaxID=543639 RepID=A0ACB8CD18_DERSI|nr:hypothetical protein HPB49_003365 [Dermacentor silvarum]